MHTGPPREGEFRWSIRFRVTDGDGSFNEEGGWKKVGVCSNCLRHLREELSQKLKVTDNFVLCIRAGRHGRLTPLLIDLPISKDNGPIDLVIPPHGALVQHPALSSWNIALRRVQHWWRGQDASSELLGNLPSGPPPQPSHWTPPDPRPPQRPGQPQRVRETAKIKSRPVNQDTLLSKDS